MCGGKLSENSKDILRNAMEEKDSSFQTNYEKVKYLIFLVTTTAEFNTLY